MTAKTPQEIAAEIMAPVNASPGHYNLRDLIVQGIEADRAQRTDVELTTAELTLIRDWAGTTEGGWNLAPDEKLLQVRIESILAARTTA